MPAEREPSASLPLTGIHINLRDRAIEFENERGTIARIVFTGETVLVEGEGLALPASIPEADSHAEASPAPTQETPPVSAIVAAAPEAREHQPTTVLSGRLLTQPREGKSDSRGKPTAWARFAAHEEGRDEAHLYSATFHRHTAAIALGLANGSPLTVEGYPHLHADPADKRLDTLSVINLVAYPEKPEKPSRRTRRHP